MTALPFAFSDDPNNAFSSSVDQVVQYREMFLAIWNALVAVGDSVLFSCDGAADIGAGNRITTVADIIIAAAAGTAHSYGAVVIGDEIIIIEALTANPATTPRAAAIYISSSTYGAATVATNRPAAVQATRESAALNGNILGWTAAANGLYNVQWSPDEQVLIVDSKRASNGGASSGFMIHRCDPTNENGGDHPSGTNPRSAVYCYGDNTDGALNATALGSSSNWRCLGRDGVASTVHAFALCHAWAFTNWPNGRDSASEVDPFAITVGGNGSTQNEARLLGFMRWLRGVPTNTAINDRDEGDFIENPTHTHTWWSYGDVARLWPLSAGIIQ